MKAITLGIRSDGTAELLTGPEAKLSAQRQALDAFRAGGLPAGFARVEIWERKMVKAASAAQPGPEPVEEEPKAPKAPAKSKSKSK